MWELTKRALIVALSAIIVVVAVLFLACFIRWDLEVLRDLSEIPWGWEQTRFAIIFCYMIGAITFMLEG